MRSQIARRPWRDGWPAPTRLIARRGRPRLPISWAWRPSRLIVPPGRGRRRGCRPSRPRRRWRRPAGEAGAPGPVSATKPNGRASKTGLAEVLHLHQLGDVVGQVAGPLEVVRPRAGWRRRDADRRPRAACWAMSGQSSASRCRGTMASTWRRRRRGRSARGLRSEFQAGILAICVCMLHQGSHGHDGLVRLSDSEHMALWVTVILSPLIRSVRSSSVRLFPWLFDLGLVDFASLCHQPPSPRLPPYRTPSVGDAGRLLHVVRHDHDGIVCFNRCIRSSMRAVAGSRAEAGSSISRTSGSRRWPERCTAAAAGRPTGGGRHLEFRFSTSSTGRPQQAVLHECVGPLCHR